MQDALPLNELEKSFPHSRDLLEKLRENGITTYTEVFALIRDENADSTLRVDCVGSFFLLGKQVDRRKAVPPLLAALKSQDASVRGAAAEALGRLESRRAIPALIHLLEDRSQPERVRIDTAYGLSYIDDPQVYSVAKRIMFDRTENAFVRSVTIEWLGSLAGEAALDNYLVLLSDPEPDVRFWAAYGLSQTAVDRP